MSDLFKNMTNDELEKYIHENLDNDNSELAFLEYSSRLDWDKVPIGATPEEEKQIIEDLIAQRTRK